MPLIGAVLERRMITDNEKCVTKDLNGMGRPPNLRNSSRCRDGRRLESGGSIPDRGKIFSSAPERPDRHRDPLSLPIQRVPRAHSRE
jgi:hypothetical protein